jgi:hypothetical protein
MFNFGKTEKSILYGAVLLLLLFSYFLYDDSLLFRRGNDSQNELIGDMSLSKNDVRRKNSDNFSWFPAEQKDSIYQHDSIFTGEDSRASITLKDGSVIEIQPNSLVTLNIKDGQMSLDLRYGNIKGQVAKGSTLTVTSAGKEVKLDSSKQIDLIKDRYGKKALGPAADLHVDLITPSGTQVVKAKSTDPVKLRWKGTGPISKYELQVSKDDQFSEVVSRELTRHQNFDVTENLDDGNYHWRIRAYDSGGRVAFTTKSHDFTVSHYQSPEIVSPVTESVTNLEIIGKPEEIRADAKVSWTSPTDYPKFHIQVARDPEFKDMVKNVLTPDKESVAPKLQSGVYYARVAGYLPQKQISSSWSPVVKFTMNLIAKTQVLPPTPILITKKISFKPPKPDDRSPAAVRAPVVEWKPVLEVPQYKLQISKDRAFARPAEYMVKNPKTAWAQYRPGQYYYRVYSVTADGVSSLPSTVGVMNITSNDPILNPIHPVHLQASQSMPKPTPQEVKLSWSEVAYAKSYMVQVDKDDKFSKPEQFEFKSTSGVLTLPETGKYHVRVRALNDDSKSISDFSSSQIAEYSFTSPLGIPSLSEPFDKATIFLQQDTAPFVWLEWKSVSGAKVYRIEISDKPDFSKVLVAKDLSDNRFLIKNQMPLGKIFWRVRAAGENFESEWSPQREFIIYQKKNEIFIK